VTSDAQPDLRLHAVVHGVVQGVGFRYRTVLTAQRLGLTGWVANRWDRSVAVVAEGPRASLQKLYAFLQQGSRGAMVERVDTDWQEATGEFRQFTIHYER